MNRDDIRSHHWIRSLDKGEYLDLTCGDGSASSHIVFGGHVNADQANLRDAAKASHIGEKSVAGIINSLKVADFQHRYAHGKNTFFELCSSQASGALPVTVVEPRRKFCEFDHEETQNE